MKILKKPKIIEKKDITIIIQGPLKEDSLNNIESYKDFGEIIVSHWPDDTRVLKDKLAILKKEYKNLTSITSIPPEPFIHPGLTGSVQKADYRYHQFQSTHEALKICKTRYAIKTRSDEYWNNIQPLLDEFSKDDSKLITSNVFYKPYYPQRYHISDHLMIARTDLFLEAHEIIAFNDRTLVNTLATECSYGLAFLTAKYDVKTAEDLPENEKAFSDDFGYVNINTFDGYVVRWNTPPRGSKLMWQKPDGIPYMGENGVM